MSQPTRLEPQSQVVDFRYSRTKVIRITLGVNRSDIQVPPAPPRPKFLGTIDLDDVNDVSVDVRLVDEEPRRV